MMVYKQDQVHRKRQRSLQRPVKGLQRISDYLEHVSCKQRVLLQDIENIKVRVGLCMKQVAKLSKDP